ncbi:tpl protein [Streptococcus pyogenes]|uniref:Tpl protein n=1 Tax=Streptococcus pyogenes TaxID=1314 RepID=UPI0010D2E9E5|nr:Tpl protein [Streptococcus pyogenes]VGW27544.1 tpl protein [Streptococcus pyogenes]VGX76110.1 tpl protein [Streptococcus pyogenes]VGY48454.1 tpl protein [Streptococcus pyogenes]VGY62827.1 tpl protein [Streptococcus pyogenes]VGY78937.1 tpl protein [Streptococcus pyogenes]
MAEQCQFSKHIRIYGDVRISAIGIRYGKRSLSKDLPVATKVAAHRGKKAFEENTALATDLMKEVSRLMIQNQLEMTFINSVFPLDQHVVLIPFSAEEHMDFYNC